MRIRNLQVFCAWAVLLLCGCAQMSAGYKLGQLNQQFSGRILKRGTGTYNEYLSYQKEARPGWRAFFDEHGEPDYVVPGAGHSCKMAWVDEGLTAEPTFTGVITTSEGIPDEVKRAISTNDAAQENQLARAMRDAEDAIRRDAQNAYLASLKKEIGSGKSRFQIDSLEYDDSTKKGRLSIDIGENDCTAARLWARSYIETLVRDKNVALETGKKCSEGRYLMADEQIKNGKYTVHFEAL